MYCQKFILSFPNVPPWKSQLSVFSHHLEVSVVVLVLTVYFYLEMILYFVGSAGSALSILNILRAVPIGVLVLASHASTVFVETPITAAKVACVICKVFRTLLISWALKSGTGFTVHFAFLALTMPFSYPTASFRPVIMLL